MDKDLDELERRIKQQLDANLDGLDASTRTRLVEIRRNTLNQPEKTGLLQKWLSPSFAPALAASFCGVLVASAALLYKPTASLDAAAEYALVELASDPDELEAIADPGFYAWLDEMEAKTEGNGAA